MAKARIQISGGQVMAGCECADWVMAIDCDTVRTGFVCTGVPAWFINEDPENPMEGLIAAIFYCPWCGAKLTPPEPNN